MTSDNPTRRPLRGPIGWIHRWATDDPDRVAIATRGGTVSYAALVDMIESRAGVLAGGVLPGTVAPVRVDLNIPSIVDIFAVAFLGAVPLPHAGEAPTSLGEPGPDDYVCIATSGSSGVPRVVRITESNISAAVAASRDRLGTGADDRWLLCLPIHHIGGLSILWRSFESGGSVALAPFDPDLPSAIAATQPTIASMVPTMVHRILRTRPDVLSTVPRIIVGGAKLDPDLHRRAVEASVNLIVTYGATETTSQVATGAPNPDEPDRIGHPLDGFEVRVVDDEGSTVPAGDRGRIVVEGPAVSPGYLAEPPMGGRYVTGDIGSIHADGVLYVHGRVDDMIVTGGENVFLGVVAEEVRSCSGVHDAFACGVPDVEWGTAIVVVYEGIRDGAPIEREVRDRLPPHAVPKRWIRVDQLPKLDNGKHDRQAIQRIAEEG